MSGPSRSTSELAIREASLGKNHPEVATSLNNLANLYLAQGLYGRAEPRYTRALAINEAALGKNHPKVGQSLNNLAFLYYSQGLYVRAEPLFERAPPRGSGGGERGAPGSCEAGREEGRKERRARVDWAGLLRRTFVLDVFACVRCGGRRRVLAYVKEARGVRAILEHLGLPTAGARLAPAREPPQAAWC